MSQDVTAERLANRWSNPVDELCGRLRIEFEDLRPGLRHAIYLELRNNSFDPITVTNQPKIHAELLDRVGKTVGRSGMAIEGPAPTQQWAVIPRDGYIGFRIDMQNVDMPTREQGKVLVALGDKCWRVGVGSYRLETAVTFAKDETGREHSWTGELELPPAEMVVTAAMLKV